jgi:hypothetical protein
MGGNWITENVEIRFISPLDRIQADATLHDHECSQHGRRDCSSIVCSVYFQAMNSESFVYKHSTLQQTPLSCLEIGTAKVFSGLSYLHRNS